MSSSTGSASLGARQGWEHSCQGALLTVSSLRKKKEVMAKRIILAAPLPSAWLLRGDTRGSGQQLNTIGREVTTSAQFRVHTPECIYFSLLHSPVQRPRCTKMTFQVSPQILVPITDAMWSCQQAGSLHPTGLLE